MNPEQEQSVRTLAGGRFVGQSILSPMPELVALAQAVLELHDAPINRSMQDAADRLDREMAQRFAHRKGFGPGDGPSSIQPLREAMQQYLVTYRYTQPRDTFDPVQMVDGLLAILETRNIPEPKLIGGCLVGPEFVKDQFYRTIQAIRRGE
jgi:hypothetical protein